MFLHLLTGSAVNGVTLLLATPTHSATCFFEKKIKQNSEGSSVGAFGRWGDLPIRVFLS